MLSVSRWVFDGLRLISLAQEAGARRGWNPADRLAIVQHDKVATFLLKKTPFTADEIEDADGDAAIDLGFAVLYMPGRPAQTFGDNRDDYARLMHAAGSPGVLPRSTRSTSTPTTDDRPFFFHTTKLRNHCVRRAGAPAVRRAGRAPGQSRRVGDRRPDRAPGAAGDLAVPDRRSSSSDRWR